MEALAVIEAVAMVVAISVAVVYVTLVIYGFVCQHDCEDWLKIKSNLPTL